MGVSQSTARWLVPSSAIFNIACQIYGMTATPSMKDIADRNHAMFSPNPMFIAAFFFPQIAIQGYWMVKDIFAKSRRETLEYVPIFALGEVAIGLWMFFWQKEQFMASQACVMINSLAQFYGVARLPAMQPGNRLTHLVANMFAGIGILDLLDNGSIAFAGPGVQPGGLIRTLTAVGFPLITFATNPIMGASFLYNAVGLWQGHVGTSWGTLLGWTSIASAGTFLLANTGKFLNN